MLKKLSFIIVFFYLAIQYGQNVFDQGSDVRINFYFIGMSFFQLGVSFILYKAIKNAATTFFLFLCFGAFLNELLFNGSINYVDVSFGCLGFIYTLVEKKISWKFKK